MIRIITNHVPRDVVSASEMSDELRAEFGIGPGSHDEMTDDDCRTFVRYRGDWYEIGDYVTTSPGPWNHGLPDVFRNWDGYASDSFFSGTVIRYAREDGTNVDGDARVDYERVIIGRYYADETRCPNCDGENVRESSRTEDTCQECGTVWFRDNGKGNGQ